MAGETFVIDIQRFVDKANGNLDLVVRKVALDLFKRVIMKTPVDTGRAKGSWLVSINSIPTGVPGTLDKDGSATIMRVSADVLTMKAGQIITLVSNLDYINRLEYGYSKQAPAGMVRITVVEFGGVVTKAASEVAQQ